MARLCHELKVCLFGSCKATDILDNAGLHIIKTKNRDFISFFFFWFHGSYREAQWFKGVFVCFSSVDISTHCGFRALVCQTDSGLMSHYLHVRVKIM